MREFYNTPCLRNSTTPYTPSRSASRPSGGRFDPAAKEAKLVSLEARSSSPDFWQSQEAAQKTLLEIRQIRGVLDPLKALAQRLADLRAMDELLAESPDPSLKEELERELAFAREGLDRFETQVLLADVNDFKNAYLAIHAGAGGTEACDWVEMLLRMYQRWAEEHGYKAVLTELSPGDEAGVKGCTLLISGDWAYGYLKSERGVHRLVRISPFDANQRRHTSFASVDVVPELEDDAEIELEEKDLRIDTYRAGGKGGQHVNKTESAVRITHIPTGLVAQCQNERSQHRNKKVALKMLTARLARMEEEKREAELLRQYGEKGEISFGSQIRSYVLQPYQLVKDHRTDHETRQSDKVLDGAIDPFMESYLRWHASLLRQR